MPMCFYLDTGDEKKEMCLRLGAEKWVDFKTSGTNLVEDVQKATGADGPQAAVLAVGNVSLRINTIGRRGLNAPVGPSLHRLTTL